jgi:flagellar biosynthetic protein FlhB
LLRPQRRGIHFREFTGKFDQFQPVEGLKRTFGMQAAWRGVEGALKTVVVGVVLVAVIRGCPFS